MFSTCTPTFSILSRIDLTATPALRPGPEGPHHLSVSSPGSTSLQQPADRALRRRTVSFSILSRIDLTATPRARSPRVDFGLFQYPLPDRPHCNVPRVCLADRSAHLSVSSPGSTSLQPPAARGPSEKKKLSVSSPGSTSLQRRTMSPSPLRSTTFSILSRIDLTATLLL